MQSHLSASSSPDPALFLPASVLDSEYEALVRGSLGICDDKQNSIIPPSTWHNSLQSALSGLAPEEAASWSGTGETQESQDCLSHLLIQSCFGIELVGSWTGFGVVFGEVLQNDSFLQLGSGDLD